MAAQRAQNAKARSLRESGGATERREHSAGSYGLVLDKSPSEHDHSQVSTRFDHTRRSISGDSLASGLSSVELLQVSFPPRDVALSLIDIYFTYIYNAHLLYHKPTFLSDYLAGKISDAIALSVFASASL